jgi:hypothetical protein
MHECTPDVRSPKELGKQGKSCVQRINRDESISVIRVTRPARLSEIQRTAVQNAILAELVNQRKVYIVDAAPIVGLSERQARRRLKSMSPIEKRGLCWQDARTEAR